MAAKEMLHSDARGSLLRSASSVGMRSASRSDQAGSGESER
jgi:hypothetical protein